VDPNLVSRFESMSEAVIERAQREEIPILLVFVPSEQDNERILYGQEYADLSRESAIFIKILDNGYRDRPAWEVESVVPVSKLLSANPARDYAVPSGRTTLVLCDWFGNEHLRYAQNTRPSTLSAGIDAVESNVAIMDRRLESSYKQAERAYKEENTSTAVRSLLRVFNFGIIGVENFNKSVKLYHKICDDARLEIAKYIENEDMSSLRSLQRTFRNTDIEEEAGEAINQLRRNR
jgi:hypothetical protein